MKSRQIEPPPTRTLSARLPRAVADLVETRAAAQHISTSMYIADTLRGRSRPYYPALAALGEILALAHTLRREPANGAVLQRLEVMITTLHAAVRDELKR